MGSTQIFLTRGQITIISEEDRDLGDLKWLALKMRDKFYVGRSIPLPKRKTKTVLLHRIILSRMLGRDLERHEQVDHLDMNPLNNQRENLRLANATQNNYNKNAPYNKHGLKGVSLNKYPKNRPYSARIAFEGKKITIGYYATAEEAHTAYCQKLNELAGEFSRLNQNKVPTNQ